MDVQCACCGMDLLEEKCTQEILFGVDPRGWFGRLVNVYALLSAYAPTPHFEWRFDVALPAPLPVQHKTSRKAHGVLL